MRLALITNGSIQTVTQQYNFGRSNGRNFVFHSPEKQKGFLHSHSQAPNVNITVCFVDWVGLYRCPSHPYQRHQPVRVQDQSSG